MTAGFDRRIGASNHSTTERVKDDFYSTDESAIDKLLQKETLCGTVWECACGNGRLSKKLQSLGYNVISTDLVDRGFGNAGIDFLAQKQMPKAVNTILTNPPYNISTDFIAHAIDIMRDGDRAYFFLKTLFLEGKGRYERIFSKNPPYKILQSVERIKCYANDNNNGKSSAIAYAWFCFEKGYKGKTIIEWV